MGAHRLDLDLGVVLGITMTALIPCRLAARGQAWAWLPAEAAITPRAFLLGELRDLVVGAADLEENTGCRSSRLSRTWLPRRSDNWRAGCRGVSTATS